jgi:transcription elongation factor SPT6
MDEDGSNVDEDEDEDGMDDNDNEEEDEEGNFIVNEDDEEQRDRPRSSSGAAATARPKAREPTHRPVAINKANYLSSSNDGPSIDQIQDAREIFGDGFDFDDFDDEEDEDYDEDVEDEYDEDGNLLTSTKRSQLSKEELILTGLRKRFDRSQLVASFCTSRDDEIRSIDCPERYQEILQGRVLPNDEERIQESKWIADLLIKKIHEDDSEQAHQQLQAVELYESINMVLKFIQVDNLEIPFIYTYRRDYLHPILSSVASAQARQYLWFILSADEKYEKLYAAKAQLFKIISSLEEAAAASKSQLDHAAEQRRHMQKLRQILDEIEDLTSQIKHAKHEEETAKEILNDNADDDDLTREHDQQRYEQCIARHNELIQQLKAKQDELSIIRIEGDELKRQSELRMKYDPVLASKVLEIFSLDRYIPMIKNASSDLEVRDIGVYLELLIRGVQASLLSDAESSTAAAAEEKGSVGGKRAKQGGSGRKDKYTKFLQSIPNIHEFLSLIVPSISELGDALRYGGMIACTIPPCPAIRIDLFAMNYLPSDSVAMNEKQVIAAAEFVFATELSYEPSLRQAARQLYQQSTTLSTRPTKKGLLVINPFSELFGLHFLEKKPIHELYTRKVDRSLFIRLQEAKLQDLITVTINPPSYEDFLAQLGIRSLIQPSIPASDDLNPPVRESYDEFRENVLQTLYQKILMPYLEVELSRDLLRIGREQIIEESGNNFSKMLAVGPYRPVNDLRQDLSSLLLACPRRSFYGSVMTIYLTPKEPLYLAYVDRNGVLRGHDLLPAKAMNERKEKIMKFLVQYTPNVIAINASAGTNAKNLQALIEKELIREVRQELIDLKRKKRHDRRKEYADDDESLGDDEPSDSDEDDKDGPYDAQVIIVNDELARIYQHSSRAKKQYPELQGGCAAAISLARYVQEPLAEYANMFTSADATELFGYELLYLNLHPLKHLLRGIRIPMIKELERRLVDAVTEVGVDLNQAVAYDHHAAMLAFISGFGLRKADALRHLIRKSYSFIESRSDLLIHQLLGPIVYNNAIGFLRIRAENYDQSSSIEQGDDDESEKDFMMEGGSNQRRLNPLDNSRIHPECYLTYDFVQKLCADAMDMEYHPPNYHQIIVSAMKNSKAKLQTSVKSMKWIDLWTTYHRPSQTTYEDEFINKNTQERVIKTYPTELRDKLQLLDLDEYLEDLERIGKGKRRYQCEQIKDELRYPWLDLRVPMTSQPAVEEMFKVVTNETDYSLHIGLKVAGVVSEVMDQSVMQGSAFKRIQKATIRIESFGNIRGSVSAYDLLDERWDNDRMNIQDYLYVGKAVSGVVMNVNKEKRLIDVSLKPSYLTQSEAWWMRHRNQEPMNKWFQASTIFKELKYDNSFLESEALYAYEQAELHGIQSMSLDTILSSAATGSAGAATAVSAAPAVAKAPESKVSSSKRSRMRNIYHPLFMNIDYREAESRLLSENKGAGEVIFRPSSKGSDHITITWAFTADSFKHIDIEERNKPSANDLGRELYIKEADITSEAYSDLDEIYSRYIEPMNDYVSMMIKSKYFLSGSADEVEQQMRRDIDRNPARIPYYIRYERGKPGFFTLTWMSLNANSSQPVKKEFILVRPNGYRMKGQVFANPNDLIGFFKRVTTAAMNQSAQPGASNQVKKQPRKSRFAPAAPVSSYPMPPPPPMPVYGHPSVTGMSSAPAQPAMMRY